MKLQKLEETKSPVEEAYKEWWGQYPAIKENGDEWDDDDVRWDAFQMGYNASQEPKKEQKWDVVRESVKWCEEHPDESVEDYLKPQTPEQVADGLKEAFIQFDMETATFHGNGSCNNIFGPYELKEGSRISFGNTASTMMACPDMEMEMAFLEILRQADNYSVTDSTLSFQKAKMAPFAIFSLEKTD
jgi:heat shock protein HslJ